MGSSIVRDQMIPGTAIRLCWNPDCSYTVPKGGVICLKCMWTASGPTNTPRMLAKAKPYDPAEGMNGVERKFYVHLKEELRCGRIQWFAPHLFKFRIGYAAFWSPDFLVITNEGHIELVDTKAKWKGETGPHIEDDAVVKMRAIAASLPWLTVVAVWHDLGTWQRRVFK